jgi:hypothetical protein
MTLRKPACLIPYLFIILLVTALRPQAQTLPSPGASFSQITSNGVWTWYGEPKAVYYEGIHKKTYMGWISNTGTISVGSYDHATGDTVTHVIRTGYQTDDHAHPSIIMRPDGRLLVAFSAHDGAILSVYIATNPEDISSFGPEIQNKGPGFCYPNLMWMSAEGDSGRLYCFIRGAGTLPSYLYSDDWGKTWTTPKVYFQSNDNTPKPYCKYCSNGKDEIHVVIERGHRGGSYPLYYMKYTKGAFYNADGQKIGDTTALPIMNTLIDTVYNPASEGGNGSGWDIALDKSGRPVVVYDLIKDANNHIYKYFRWNGASWIKNTLVNSGANMGGEAGFGAGITLDHENTSVVYLSRQVNGSVHEIDKWVTRDSGTTWDTTPITRGSAKKNTRPCVPRGHKAGGNIEVIWNYGDYTTYNGGAWNMAVKMYPFRQPVAVQMPLQTNARNASYGIQLCPAGLKVTSADLHRASFCAYSLDGRLLADLSPIVRSAHAASSFVPFSAFSRANAAFIVIFNDGKSTASMMVPCIK